MNLRGMLRGIRIRVRDPRAQQPSDRTLLKLLSDQVQNLSIEANLRGRYWAVDETELQVTANTGDYLIPIANFGKPIEVYTSWPGNPSYVTRTVDFFELGDLNYQWDMPGNFALSSAIDGSPHTAHRIAFYHKQGQVYARVMPTPAGGAQYKVIYQVGQYGATMPLSEEIMLPEFAQLVEVRTAIAALPHCEWVDEEARNEARRRELALTLDRAEKQSYALFKSYVATQTAGLQPNQRIAYLIDE